MVKTKVKAAKTADRSVRRAEYDEIFRDVDANEKKLIDPLIDEVVECEERMAELKQYPFIAVHPSNPSKQRITPAARLYKDFSASRRENIRVMLNVLRKVETSAQDELLRKLAEFE